MHFFPGIGHELGGVGHADGPLGPVESHVHALLEFTGADTDKGDPVSVGWIHVGLNLEDKASKAFIGWLDHYPFLCLHCGWRWRQIHKGIEEGLDPETC